MIYMKICRVTLRELWWSVSCIADSLQPEEKHWIWISHIQKTETELRKNDHISIMFVWNSKGIDANLAKTSKKGSVNKLYYRRTTSRYEKILLRSLILVLKKDAEQKANEFENELKQQNQEINRLSRKFRGRNNIQCKH